MTPARRFWLRLHRWAGIAMALPLILTALTGSVLAFYGELERAINPQRYPIRSDAARLGTASLIEHAQRHVPQAKIKNVYLLGNADATYVMLKPRLDPATGKKYHLDFDQLFLDPYTGAELERSRMSDLSITTNNVMNVVYKLHYTLLLKDIGVLVLGIIGVVWTIDSFLGFYLTLPRKFPKGWRVAWLIKWHASATRINFDIHRALGLWFWIVLLMFAWSSVYMNLWDSVYTKVTRVFFEYHAPWTDLPLLQKPIAEPKIDWPLAARIGERLMAEQARRHGFNILQPVYLRLYRDRGVYTYRVRSDRDIQDRRGRTDLLFDMNTGELRLFTLPTGQHGGNTLTNWLYALHMGNVFGLPYRIFVAVFGLTTIALTVTGIAIWLRKRRHSFR